MKGIYVVILIVLSLTVTLFGAEKSALKTSANGSQTQLDSTESNADDYVGALRHARNAVIHTKSGDVTIPPPKGFWTPEDNEPLAKILKAEAEADKFNKTFGQWVSLRNGNEDDMQEATVKMAKGLVDKQFPLEFFEKMREAIKRESSSIAQKLKPEVSRAIESVTRENVQDEDASISSRVEDIRVLPPHLDLSDRIGLTSIRKDVTVIDGRKSVSFAVFSNASIWVRGSIINLSIGYCVETESEVDGAVAESREKLKLWLAEIDAVNQRPSSGYGDIKLPDHFDIPTSKNYARFPKSENRLENALSKFVGKIMASAVCIGIASLFGLFKRKKDSGRKS